MIFVLLEIVYNFLFGQPVMLPCPITIPDSSVEWQQSLLYDQPLINTASCNWYLSYH